MSKTNPAAQTAKKKAARKVAKKAAPAAAESEPIYLCEVISALEDGTPRRIGSMVCGIGAWTKQPKSNAKDMEAEGWVRILGMA